LYKFYLTNTKTMKTIIAGSRNIHDYNLLLNAVAEANMVITEVVSGGAGGVDALGEKYARANGLALKVFPAAWGTHGRAAGPIRNAQMAEYADQLIAVWDGKSPGTKSMIDLARKNQLAVYVYRTE